MKNRTLARLLVVLSLVVLWIATPFTNKAMAQTTPAPVTATTSSLLGNCIKPELKGMINAEKKAACAAALRAYADLLDEGVTSTTPTTPSSTPGKKHTCTITGTGDNLGLCDIAFGAMGDQQEPYRFNVVITGESGPFDGKVLIPDLMIMVDGKLCGDKYLRFLREFGATTTNARRDMADAASECVQPQTAPSLPIHTMNLEGR